jgi:hypothetical protein
MHSRRLAAILDRQSPQLRAQVKVPQGLSRENAGDENQGIQLPFSGSHAYCRSEVFGGTLLGYGSNVAAETTHQFGSVILTRIFSLATDLWREPSAETAGVAR